MDADKFQRIEISTPEALWDWLSKHHAHADSVWLVTFKKSVPDKYVDRSAVLDALIAYGWVDGRRMKLDDTRTMQLISPRKQQVWAKSYKDRASQLERDGRMKPPGQAAINAAKASGRWDRSKKVDALHVPDELRDALEARFASTWFDAAAPSYRRNVLRWYAAAKKPETKAKRAAIIADHASRGEKVPQY